MNKFEKFNAWLISKDKIAEPPATPQDKYGVDKVPKGHREKRERSVPAFQKCQLCEEVLPAEAFSPCKVYKSGLRPYCRRCMTVYSQVRREKSKTLRKIRANKFANLKICRIFVVPRSSIRTTYTTYKRSLSVFLYGVSFPRYGLLGRNIRGCAPLFYTY